MKVIVTTSDAYHHIIPIFCYLFNHNWSSEQEVELVGYKQPEFELPSNFKFVSLGVQGEHASCFSTDLRPYFEQQDDWFIWLFEDTFIVEVNHKNLETAIELTRFDKAGRVNLSRNGLHEKHIYIDKINGLDYFENTQDSNYRLSTQPSIWNKQFLLQYLTPKLSPWRFEVQGPTDDGWRIFGLYDHPVVHNEGVRRNDIYAYNLNGVNEYQIRRMKTLGIL
jgi:hypothetical protein